MDSSGMPVKWQTRRERREDIPLLVQHFTQKYAHKFGKQIETEETRHRCA
jgi:DNA-binding NtrC family response regulator